MGQVTSARPAARPGGGLGVVVEVDAGECGFVGGGVGLSRRARRLAWSNSMQAIDRLTVVRLRALPVETVVRDEQDNEATGRTTWRFHITDQHAR